ncbi:MAG: hypothetical protein H6Q77_2136 [Gemmatimonadetes bacterium]|nr:hypothetical protein [Gemmatimonadota bacterium]
MTQDADRSYVDQLGEKPLVRVVAYYVALAAIVVLLSRVWPDILYAITAKVYGKVGQALGTGAGSAEVYDAGSRAPLEVAAVCVSSIAVMLPVAWICALTRSKQGYRQSLVQTLLVLPVVVAGIVGIVRNSQALAFGLAGVVAAVSFRNRLEDSKDTVYIFIATAVGFACGVQAVDIALVVSLIFNALVLLLWWTDFGRVPGAVQGGPVEQRLKRALAMANRTQQFVSMVDQEILRSLGPDQLAQVANRVAARQSPLVTLVTEPTPRPTRPLTIVLSGPDGREVVEEALEQHAKLWTFKSTGAGPRGHHTLRYEVRLRKKVPEPLFLERMREAGGARIVDVALGPEIRS